MDTITMTYSNNCSTLLGVIQGNLIGVKATAGTAEKKDKMIEAMYNAINELTMGSDFYNVKMTFNDISPVFAKHLAK